MQALHRGDLSAALALIDTRHSEQALKRHQMEQALSALHALAAQPAPAQSSHSSQALRVGEAARQVGVRVSALHFWEQQDLLHPVRDQSSRYRLYDEHQMSRLRVVVLLREARYDFNVIRSVLDELEAGRPKQAIVAVEKRREELTRTSWMCIEAYETSCASRGFFPLQRIEQLTEASCGQTTRARKLTVVLVVWVLICWHLYLRHSLGAVFLKLSSAERWLAEEELEALPTCAAWTYRRKQIGVRLLRAAGHPRHPGCLRLWLAADGVCIFHLIDSWALSMLPKPDAPRPDRYGKIGIEGISEK